MIGKVLIGLKVKVKVNGYGVIYFHCNDASSKYEDDVLVLDDIGTALIDKVTLNVLIARVPYYPRLPTVKI